MRDHACDVDRRTKGLRSVSVPVRGPIERAVRSVGGRHGGLEFGRIDGENNLEGVACRVRLRERVEQVRERRRLDRVDRAGIEDDREELGGRGRLESVEDGREAADRDPVRTTERVRIDELVSVHDRTEIRDVPRFGRPRL
ncbi:hypothetical protein [Natrinema gelatinilyticum]|uniref:hypothetical protein n=1 Tax=Natrinema gelatinilyticum TaxID=2961571 RepID=UPI0020C4C361|nr:hypothetical protein [Natrinema gelatinilyticum]